MCSIFIRQWVEDGIWDESERADMESEYTITDVDVYDAARNYFPLRMEFNAGNGGLNTGIFMIMDLFVFGCLFCCFVLFGFPHLILKVAGALHVYGRPAS
jgi:hypothetical protein